MEQDRILQILQEVKAGAVTPEQAMLDLKMCPFEDLGYAKVDHHRALRQGVPEVIFGSGKTPGQIVGITRSMLARGSGVLITRLSPEAAEAVETIKNRIHIPLVADIHFDYRLAIAAAEHGADKIRINPGNIGSPERVRMVADACRDHGVPIRVGVNSGSVEKGLLEKYGLCAKSLCESALGHVKLLEDCGFEDICISVKASDVAMTVEANRLLSTLCDYPLHIGVTEAGTKERGILKSAAGIGALLLDGIGDTIRVSLTADPVEEVRAGIAILKAAGLRREGVRFVSCPTCGRTQIDLIALAQEVEQRLQGIEREITVAVMGCVVNGPGEAHEADYGIAGGKDCGLLFRRGEILGKYPADKLADALVDLILSEK